MSSPNFLAVISPPPDEKSILSHFWSIAPTSLRSLAIDQTSEINIIINSLIRGEAMLWGSISNFGLQLVSLAAAKGIWLKVLAKGRYDLDYLAAMPTIGSLNMSSSSASSAGSVTLINTDTGITYSGTVPSMSSTDHVRVTFVASQPGPQGDCDFAKLTIQQAPSNVIFDLAVGHANTNAQDWITQRGMGDESDAHLKQRCYDVIHARSSGGQGSIAAQIRAATNNQVWRVWSPRFSSNIYVAAYNGPASTAWDAAALLAAQQYSINSVTPILIGCATPITQTILRLTGTIAFANGTPSQVVSSVLQGLSDYINQLPICTGEGKDQITLSTLERMVLSLDSSKTALPSLGAIVNGTRALQLSDPIVAPPGTIYRADLSALQVIYQ